MCLDDTPLNASDPTNLLIMHSNIETHFKNQFYWIGAGATLDDSTILVLPPRASKGNVVHFSDNCDATDDSKSSSNNQLNLFWNNAPPPHTTTSVYYEFMNIILGKYEFWGEMKKRNDGSEKMSPSHWINKSFVEMCRRINYQIEFQMGFYSSLIQSPASLDWIKDKNENKERLFR